MHYGLISDIHLTKKPYRLISALRLLQDVDILLVAGDLSDKGTPVQYELLEQIFNTHFPNKPIFIVSGNHDIPGNDESAYRAFEKTLAERFVNRYSMEADAAGAYYIKLDDHTDLIGLNPLYTQKVFRFPNKGEQISFAEQKLNESKCRQHFILCHPPLLAHNPQRGMDRQPYLPKEQDDRMQKMVDSHTGILFLSGHTHVYPEIEADSVHGNLYINDGSLCPTQMVDNRNQTYQGNVIVLDLNEKSSDMQILHL